MATPFLCISMRPIGSIKWTQLLFIGLELKFAVYTNNLLAVILNIIHQAVM